MKGDSRMDSYERCKAALDWARPDRVPVIPQNSDMAIHLAGYDMAEASKDPRKLASALVASQERFGYDGIMLGPDAAILAEALGCEVAYRAEDPPAVVGPALSDLADYRKLRVPDATREGRMPVWLEAARLIREKLGRSIFLVCRADQCAFSLAALLLGMENLSILLAEGERVEEIKAFLAFCNECHIAFARAISATGADMTTCGDSYGGPGIIGPANYREYVFPFEKAAAAAIQGEIGLPYSIHICGDTNAIHGLWPETGAACFEVDHKTEVSSLRRATLGRNAILGNLDTNLLCSGSVREVEAACAELIATMKPESGFFLSSGCSMSANSSPELLEAMVESAKRFGGYDEA